MARDFAERPHKEGKAIIQVASLFNQLLPHFPRTEFGALVKKNDAEKAAKGFGCWTQLVSMLFCQLAHADSTPRDLQRPGLLPWANWCISALPRLPVNPPLVCQRTPSPPSCTSLFYTALNRFRDEEGLGQRKEEVPFQEQSCFRSDSTTISLCLKLFPWAKFRRAKGGVRHTSC